MLNSQLLSYVTFIYGLAAALYWAQWVFRKDALGKAATIAALAGFVGNLAGFVLRWVESHDMGVGHVPLSNLYESLVFFALITMAAYLIVEYQYRIRSLGAFATTLSFLAMAYASLPDPERAAIRPLIPALKSNWLTAHVFSCFLGYAAFALAFGLAHLYLLKKKSKGFAMAVAADAAAAVVVLGAWGLGRLEVKMIFAVLSGLCLGAAVFIVVYYTLGHIMEVRAQMPEGGFVSRLPETRVLDELMYQNILFGFLFLSAGIITGAVWANTAWGRYWSWDPKETWSLITWFIYAALIHSRLIRGWRGERVAYFAVFGFFCVLFTWFGVNLLPGLHSYANM